MFKHLSKIYSMLLVCSISGLLLVTGGCESEGRESEDNPSKAETTIHPNPVKAPPELIEKIKATGWLDLKSPCNAGHVSMSPNDYQDCILVEAALLPSLDMTNRDHFGEEYNPGKYYECRKKVERNNMSCTELKLLRDEAEPVWPYPDVPPIQWPDAPKEQVYRKGMNSEEYFDALCKAEAGKFIYKTVEDVEGVYQIRPRKLATDYMLEDRYVLENPYHYSLGETGSMGGAFLGPGNYEFWETSLYEPKDRWETWRKKYHHESMFNKPSSDAQFIRYEGYDGKRLRTITKEYVPKLKSNYGYIWRGIMRLHDRKHAIAGGELVVIDLKTNEILGLWRGFSRSGNEKSKKVWWLAPQPCPGRSGDSSEISGFIKEVLIPRQSLVEQGGESK